MRSAIIGHTKDMNLHSSIDKYKGHDAMTWSNDDDKSLWEISQCLAITVTVLLISWKLSNTGKRMFYNVRLF